MSDHATMAPEVRMGNDIARQFGHLEHEAAATAVGTHLDKFWERRMLRRLRELVDTGQADDADPLLVDGLAKVVFDDTDEQEKREPSGG